MESKETPAKGSVELRRFKSISDVPYEKDPDTRWFRGSHSIVSKAFSKSNRLFGSNRKVFAIKEIDLGYLNAREKVESEIQFLRRCNHRNIVGLVDAYEIEQKKWANMIFLVMEPWAPTSLQIFFEMMARNDSDLAVVCPWFSTAQLQHWPDILEQCIHGLQYLHEHDIRHKDLKPANILLLNESNEDQAASVRVILADLGISKRFNYGTETSFQGTYSYLAPEQIEKIGSTHKSDIFSLGCCFAMIEAVILAGRDGLIAIEAAAMGTDSCQFAHNLRLIHDALLEIQRFPTHSPIEAMFRDTLRTLVAKMLDSNPLSRPDIREVSQIFMEYKPRGERSAESPRLLLHLILKNRDSIRLKTMDVSVKTPSQQLSNNIEDAYKGMQCWLSRFISRSFGTPYNLRLVKFGVLHSGAIKLDGQISNWAKFPSDTELEKQSYQTLFPGSVTIGLEVKHATELLPSHNRGGLTYWERGIPVKVSHLMNSTKTTPKNGPFEAVEWGLLIQESDYLPLIFYMVMINFVTSGLLLRRGRSDTVTIIFSFLLNVFAFIQARVLIRYEMINTHYM